MSEKTDRRVQRTKQLLKEAVLELAVEVGFDRLTIEQITERANLGRTTFYLHYNDKSELLLDSLQSQIDSIFQEIYSEENIQKWVQDGIDPRKRIFEYAAENHELFRLLFTDEVSGMVSNQFRAHIAFVLETITKTLQEQYNATPRLPNPVVANYVSGALVGLLVWWLENDMPYTPEAIYNMYHTLMVEGAVSSIGVKRN